MDYIELKLFYSILKTITDAQALKRYNLTLADLYALIHVYNLLACKRKAYTINANVYLFIKKYTRFKTAATGCGWNVEA